MIAGASVDRHHWRPKSQGGREQDYLHRICHQKIHSLWTERELRDKWNDPEKIRLSPSMRSFLTWIIKQPIEYYGRTLTAKKKGQR